MKEYNFSKIISKKTYIDEINSKTLSYYINGIINSCCSFLDGKNIDVFADEFGKLMFKDNSDNKLIICAYKTHDTNRGDCINLHGWANELSFSFNDYYRIENINRKIVINSFNINLIRLFNDIKYEIVIKSGVSEDVQFSITKNNNEKLQFYTMIGTFKDILDIIKEFVINPDMVFDIYDVILENGPIKSLKMYK